MVELARTIAVSPAMPARGPHAMPVCELSGSVHSWETGSTVDGPGVRMVVWLSGCQMRCLYCHNPDTWQLRSGRRMSVEDLMREVVKYQRFLRVAGGGITLSGGEPLLQSSFTMQILRACHALGIHTALDTNGLLGQRLDDADLEQIDLTLLDIKSWDRALHRQLTGTDLSPVLSFARRLSERGRPAWIRFVLVPGLTDGLANLEGLADFIATLRSVQRVEVLPFHQLGRYKWQELHLPYALADTETPSAEMMARACAVFRSRGLPLIEDGMVT